MNITCEISRCEGNEESMNTGSDSMSSPEYTKLGAARMTDLATVEVLRFQNPMNNENQNDCDDSKIMHLNDSGHFSKYRVNRQESEDYDLCHPKKFHSTLLNDCFNDSMEQILYDSECMKPKESQKHKSANNEMEPKVPSTLTYTNEHPLMNGEVYYPDIVPEKSRLEGKLSLSVDDKYSSAFEYGPQRNTSKNNLYFSENLSAFDDYDVSKTPDVANVIANEESRTKVECRKIAPVYSYIDNVKYANCERSPSCVLGRPMNNSTPTLAENLNIYVEQRKKRLLVAQRTDSSVDDAYRDADQTGETLPIDIPTPEKYDSGPVEWAESPSHLRSMSNIKLPVELSSCSVDVENVSTPDPLSISEERSLFAAALDPAHGSAALRHTPSRPDCRRRLIAVAPEDTEDRESVDSGSVCSLEEADLPLDGDTEADPEVLPVPGDMAIRPTAPEETNPLADVHRDPDSDEESKMEPKSDSIAEYSGAEENARERSVKRMRLHTGETVICDMKVIEPYKRVLSHGGYTSDGRHVVVVSACYLPDNRSDYNYVLDNLALYVMWTLERLVAGDYVLVYLAAPHRRAPSIGQLEKLARRVDYRLRKSLRSVYVVHGSWWLRTLLLMMRAFVSSKLWRKVHHVRCLADLHRMLPELEPAAIPQPVRDHDNALQH